MLQPRRTTTTMTTKRQTSSRLIIAVAAAVQLLTAAASLQLLSCIAVEAVSDDGDHHGDDPRLDAIHFGLLMGQGLDVNPRAELLHRVLESLRQYVANRSTTMLVDWDGPSGERLVKVIQVVQENLTNLPLAVKTRSEIYVQLLRIYREMTEFEGLNSIIGSWR